WHLIVTESLVGSTVALIINEEIGPVPSIVNFGKNDRAADLASKCIQSVLRSERIKETTRVQSLVGHEIPRVAMQMLAARLRDRVYDPSGGAAHVRPEVIGYDRYRLQRVRVWQRRGGVVLLVIIIIAAVYPERI